MAGLFTSAHKQGVASRENEGVNMPFTNYYTVNGEIIGEQTTGQDRIDYLTDPLGNVTATIDQNAKVLNRYTYKPFGEVLSKEGTAPDPKFLWVGAHGYRQTGNKHSDVYVRARHYDTRTGRWTSRDPLWPQQPAYSYGKANPIVNLDPSGKIACIGKIDKDPCNEEHPYVPGWYDDPAFDRAIQQAKSECSKYSPAYVRHLLFCIVARETKGRKDEFSWPLEGENRPIGPCQIWPGKDKDTICKGLRWQDSLLDHMKCCARLLCWCIEKGEGNVVKGCGTIGSGSNRRGTWQVINQSDPNNYDPAFKCCLIRRGIKSPLQIIPRRSSM
jgi:RHS repeat-associated protein